MITFKAIIIPGNRRKDGTYPVNIRVTFKGKSKRLATTLVCTAADLTRSLKIKNPTILNKSDALIAKMRTDASGYIYGYRITRSGDTFTAELVKTIAAPTIDTNVMQFYILDLANKQVALYGYQTDTNGAAEINLYDVSDWEEGATFTATGKQIVYPHFGGWPFQSGFFRDGKLYMLCGTHQQNARIYCFDFDISNIDGVIDLRREAFNIPMREEPQGLCIYEGRIIFSGSYYIYELFL